MKLAFSTLGCPEWSLEEIIRKAVEYGYEGVELRGLQGELSLPLCPEFSKEKRMESKKTFQKNRLEIACVSTSCILNSMVLPDKEKNFKEAKSNLELARDLESKYIRVFGGDIPEGKTLEQYQEAVIANLQQIAEEAGRYGVQVLVETHDALILGKDLSAILEKIDSPYAGVVWDINHPYRGGEKIEDSFRCLKKYLRHIHLKDSKIENNSLRSVLIGKGDVPIKQVLDILKENKYTGYLSYEWEKVWHPDIEEPEVAFPIFSKKIKNML
jgi:sugar phosphate isomerase/epimerase